MTIAQIIVLAFRLRRWQTVVPRRWHQGVARILGLQIRVSGRISRARPTLFVCNHVSYLDITVLGALLDGSFVAKKEVGGWPLFGLLSRLQRTVFIDRRKASSLDQRDSLRGRLEAGDSLILFPEGTSSDGLRTLPFKSALFAVSSLTVDGEPLTVQPVTVTCTHMDGIPLGRWLKPVYAWYGDMELGHHVWEMAGMGNLSVQVQFHPSVTVTEAGSRKALALAAWAQVNEGLAAANAGRNLGGVKPRFAQRQNAA